MRKRSRVTHPPRVTVPRDNRPLVDPVYQSVKFTFDDVGETRKYWSGQREGYYYSRRTNPTLRQLELLLAELQGREDCLVTGSGIAAIAVAMLHLLKTGDHVVYFAEMYGPTQALVRRLLARFGVSSTMLSIDRLEDLERTLGKSPTRLVVFESPSNPVLKVADIERLTALARAAGALTLMDNTLAGVHNHGDYDVDVFAHSLTKYASGHGDVMGGAVIGNRDIVAPMRDDAALIGAALDPHAAYLLLRGMKTYFLRWDRQCSNAQAVAEFLAAHPAVERVRYPGLAGDPGRELAARQMDRPGTMVTFDLKSDLAGGDRFAEALRFFTIAASLGSTESLVLAPSMQQPRSFPEEQRRWTDIGPGTVRLSIGVEDVEDLLEDLGQALGALDTR
jgi:cystathionine beta-lyase/cystathionine gamma-synthase